MKGSKSKASIVVGSLLVVLVVGALVWMVCCKDKTEGKENEEKEIATIQRKKAVVECHKDSEITFNGYSFKLVAEKNEGPDCTTNSVMINGVEKKEKLVNWGILQYEIFGDYLLYMDSSSSAMQFGVYNMKTDTLNKYTAKETEYFMIKVWQSDDKGITLTGTNVAEQFGASSETSHKSAFAQFRMTYVDGTFTDPIFLKEFD